VNRVVKTEGAAPTTWKLVIVCRPPSGRVDETALSLGSETKVYPNVDISGRVDVAETALSPGSRTTVAPDNKVAEFDIGRLRRKSILAKQRLCLRCIPDELRTE
jgi:hypothetical protein